MLFRSAFVAFTLVLSAVSGYAEESHNVPDVTLDGYYRVRGIYLNNPDLDSSTQPNVERYFQHRLRLTPHIFINENISAHLQADIMNDQIWGATSGNILSQSTSDTEPNLLVRRAYGEIKTPVGVFRVGRMGSQWGKGLLSNDGDGFRNEFGDAHGGDTYDRILFATKPLGADGPLTTALLYDKIIETDFPGAATDARRKGDVDEYGLVVHYKQDWLTAGVYTIYRLQSKTDTSAIIPDVYLAVQTEKFHFDFEGVMINGSTKGVTAFFVPDQVVDGKKITALTFSQPKTDIMMVGGASEIGMKPIKMLDLALETGYASGDKPGSSAFEDKSLTSFSFDPDYNVGLLMFEYANQVKTENELAAAFRTFNTPTPRLGGRSLSEVCATACVNGTDFPSAAAAQRDFLNSTATAFVPSNGAVRNAFYLFPKIRVQPIDPLKLVFGVLWAKALEGIATRQIQDNANTLLITETDKGFNYGLEFDFGANYDFTEDFHFGLQAGLLRPGKVFELASGGKAPNMFLIQPRFTVTF